MSFVFSTQLVTIEPTFLIAPIGANPKKSDNVDPSWIDPNLLALRPPREAYQPLPLPCLNQ